jgi:bacillopeptidase F
MFALMEGMDWLMAPTDVNGKNPRPDLAPDIVTNSWGGAPTSNPFLWASLRNWKRAGIVPIFAAGNDRSPKPGQVAVPGMYDETITVGASDRDDSRAWFSMYGPSDFSREKKPEITAPGVKIYSTTPDGEFHDTLIEDGKQYLWQGTSMATPHVTGAVALYLQAHPNASFEEIRQALKASGTHPGAPTEEDGSGRVQVDKLIAPGTIDPAAKLADPKRVSQLMDEVARAKEYPGDPAPEGVVDMTHQRPDQKAQDGKDQGSAVVGGVVLSPSEDGAFGAAAS